MPIYNETVEVNRPWGDWLFLRQQRDTAGGGGFHIHNPWGNSNQGQGAPERNRLEVGYRTSAGQEIWGQFVIHGPSGRVGIGTGNPQGKLEISSPWGDWLFLRQERDTGGGGGFHIHNPWGNSNQGQGAPDRNRLEIGYRTSAGQDLWGHFVIDGPSGRVGIGTVAPQARLHVAGDVMVSGDIVLQHADCAEEFSVAERVSADPGTVMVLAEGGKVAPCTARYDKKVAGVVSGAADYRPAIVLDRRTGRGNSVPIALVGKVYCKVDSAYGPIEAGDLLTTSDTPGHAMKAADPAAHAGAILGKALESFNQDKGLVPILVTLL